MLGQSHFQTVSKQYKCKYYKILLEFPCNRKQKVFLNSQCSSRTDNCAGISQGSIPGPLRFLLYIKNLSDGLKRDCKLFADDTSLFYVIHGINTLADDPNRDLEKISN